MPTYSQGPRLLKGAIVAIDPAASGRSTIVFQYNPETLKRSLEPQLAGAQGGERSQALCYTGAPCTSDESACAGRRTSKQEGRLMKTTWRLVLFLAVLSMILLSCSTNNGLSNPEPLEICSFNIQFLGQYKKRDSHALASILDGCDIVAVQELVAPPCNGVFPNGDKYKSDAEAAEFFEAMKVRGFDYVLSPEDTGRGPKNHINSSATEWWVAFYLPSRVKHEGDVASQFLADDRTANPDYDRVPYAFAFRTLDGKLDFVLISVHLHPNAGLKNRERRVHELATIAKWIDDHDNGVEKDFIILGDMNIENAAELTSATPEGFVSLNDECRCTNTNVKGPKPYDHVMYNPTFTTEIDEGFDLKVINLIEVMKDKWTSSDPYPGDPYVHDKFRQIYSDHRPVMFNMTIPAEDDD